MGRVSIEGYSEEGTTTSPFDVSDTFDACWEGTGYNSLFMQMMLCNHTSRFDVAIAAIRGGAAHNPKVALAAHEAESYIKHMAKKEREYIYKTGKGVLWF